MSITYTWAVRTVKTCTVENQAGYIFQTYWDKTGTDEDGNVGSFAGATPFTPAITGDFTPFEQLTEAQVLGWIQAVVVGDYEAHVNGQIQKAIDAKKAQVQEAPELPWATPAIESAP